MQFIETPPPTLLRAQLAVALDHLPSVPSVVLPIMSLIRNNQAHLLLKPFSSKIRHFVHIELNLIINSGKISQSDG
jgi:hypothetical protein